MNNAVVSTAAAAVSADSSSGIGSSNSSGSGSSRRRKSGAGAPENGRTATPFQLPAPGRLLQEDELQSQPSSGSADSSSIEVEQPLDVFSSNPSFQVARAVSPAKRRRVQDTPDRWLSGTVPETPAGSAREARATAAGAAAASVFQTPATTPRPARAGVGTATPASTAAATTPGTHHNLRSATHSKLPNSAPPSTQSTSRARAASTTSSVAKKGQPHGSATSTTGAAAESPPSAPTPPTSAAHRASTTLEAPFAARSASPVSSAKSSLSVTSSSFSPPSSSSSFSSSRRGRGRSTQRSSTSTAKTARGSCRRDSGDPVVFSLPSHQPPRPTPGTTGELPPPFPSTSTSSQPARQDFDAAFFFSPLHESKSTSGTESPTSFQPLGVLSPTNAASAARGRTVGERKKSSVKAAAAVGEGTRKRRHLVMNKTEPKMKPASARQPHPLLSAFIGDYFANL